MFLATVFRTTFGFGEALVAVPLLALLIPIKLAAPVAVLASIIIAGFVVARDWRHIHLRDAALLIVSTILGLPLGLLLLKAVPEPVTKGVLSVIILAFSIYSLFPTHKLSLKSDRYAWAFGLIAGITGGSYGMNGPPLAIYGSLRNWTPERFRATLQGYFLPASVFGICGYGAAGLWTASVNHFFVWSLPAVLLGIFVGRLIGRAVNARRFGILLHCGLILVALILLAQAFIESGVAKI